jgi:hypothetical protein
VAETLGGETVEYCALGADYDLTGSEVRATRPVAVVGGHNCTFVPFNRWACDHLEEQLFPVESWGRDVLVSTTEPIRREPNLLRIVSGHDGNVIRFEPELVPELVLGRGELVDVEVSEHVRVVGSQPLAVVQLLVGQDYFGRGASGPGGTGDPSMSLGIPTEQLRTEYTFLAPDTYTESFVNVTAPEGSRVLLDGRLLDVSTPIGATGHAAARIAIEPGVHRIEGNAPFGIVVYGFARYTSYMVPGGLDLRAISPPI